MHMAWLVSQLLMARAGQLQMWVQACAGLRCRDVCRHVHGTFVPCLQTRAWHLCEVLGRCRQVRLDHLHRAAQCAVRSAAHARAYALTNTPRISTRWRQWVDWPHTRAHTRARTHTRTLCRLELACLYSMPPRMPIQHAHTHTLSSSTSRSKYLCVRQPSHRTCSRPSVAAHVAAHAP